MLDAALRTERSPGRENEAWLVGFPIVALIVAMMIVQLALALLAADPSTTGVCRSTGGPESRFMAMMLH